MNVPAEDLEPEVIKARSQSEADDRFVRSMNRSLRLLTRYSMWRSAHVADNNARALILTDDPAPLPCRGDRHLFFTGTLAYTFEPDRRDEHRGATKVSVDEYIYSLRTTPDERDEFAAWHWHPTVADSARPHVHVRADHLDVPDLRDMHFPTSRVFFEQVLLFAIENLHADCRAGSEDALLDQLRRTRTWATWH